MDSNKVEMCKSLIEWFKTLNLKALHSNADEISDGVALAQALNQFAPDSFTEIWLSKIKTDISSNWRLKMSNLKKVIEGVYDYYSEVLNYSLSNFPRPDAMRIAERSDNVELERLLELILGCAVNCNEKQNYIKQIMSLEETLQQNIMKALQNLESTWQGISLAYNPIKATNFDIRVLQEERDIFAQKFFDAEKMIHLLLEEKSNLQQELSKIKNDVEEMETVSVIGDDGVSLGPMQIGSVRYNDLRYHMHRLKEELLQSETSREDLKIKIQQQEKDMITMQQRIDELIKCTVDLPQLKDEIDVLRESNDKLKMCEVQLTVYKKKLEDYNILKKKLRVLEEKSDDYIQRSTHYEENVKKYATLKGQIELFKKETHDLNLKINEERSKNAKLQFDNRNLENNYHALQRTTDNLCKERESLKDAIDELKCCAVLKTSANGSCGIVTMSKELHTTVLTETLQRLEAENKVLREGQGGQAAVMQLLDDANKCTESLREQLEYANEGILCSKHVSLIDAQNLERNEFKKQLSCLMDLNEQKVLQLEARNSSLLNKISLLETTLSIREQEMISCETKYRRSIEKAKEIIKNLDPRITKVTEGNDHDKSQELEKGNNPAMTKFEAQLISTAFYRLGVNTQRDATDTKLAYLMGQGQTFLSRQRQSRKTFTAK